jgi:glyoxylase-like metal-dependent hydrolase (beta-lactamase superfamily II)
VKILSWRVPPYDNATYLLYDDRKDAIVIDPSMGEREVLTAARENGLRIVEILNTHGHPDHIYGNAAVKEATRARLAIHHLDAYRLDHGRRPGVSAESRAMIGDLLDVVPNATADDLIEEGPLRYVADIDIEALHTPGHTEGSTSFYLPNEGALFSGDLLFRGNVGRWDLPGGDASAMQESLGRVARLAAETTVYPGHGSATTIGRELPTLRGLRDAGVLAGLHI